MVIGTNYHFIKLVIGTNYQQVVEFQMVIGTNYQQEFYNQVGNWYQLPQIFNW